MRIELHIDRLVLDGALLGGERTADVRAALQRELTALLGVPGALEALRGLGAVDALPPLRLGQARHARDRLGGRIATAVGQGLGIGTVAPTPGAGGAQGGRHG